MTRHAAIYAAVAAARQGRLVVYLVDRLKRDVPDMLEDLADIVGRAQDVGDRIHRANGREGYAHPSGGRIRILYAGRGDSVRGAGGDPDMLVVVCPRVTRNDELDVNLAVLETAGIEIWRADR